MSLQRPRRRGPAVGLVAVLATVGTVPLVLGGTSAAAGLLPVAGPLPAQGATLTASAGVLEGLVFEGIEAVATTEGEVDTLRLSSRSATLTGLGLEVSCRPVGDGLGGMTYLAMTPADSTSSAASGLTMHARSVTATLAGVAVSWTPTSPPPAEQLGDATLTDVSVELAALEAPALELPGLRQATEFCTP